MFEWIMGKRTYLCVAGGIVVAGLNAVGVVNDDIANTLYALLGFGGIAGLRAGLTTEIKPAVTAANETKATVQSAVLVVEEAAATAEESAAATTSLLEEQNRLFLLRPKKH